MEMEVYQTSDINLAATLLTLGFEVLTINPTNPDRILFLFNKERYPRIEEIVSNYWSNKITINPKDLFTNRRDLLTRVKEAQRTFGEIL